MVAVGDRPVDLGLVEIADGEMLFAMYLPISVVDDHAYHLPEHLKRFAPVVSAAKEYDRKAFHENFVYLTAKTLWVEGGYIGNRPGWHIDGFGTNDVNYIWADRAPTEFLIGAFHVSEDCDRSMEQMEGYAKYGHMLGLIHEYPDRHLLRLTPTVIHRSPAEFEPGYRTFVKVSLSYDQYNLKGNAVNHLLPETHWPLVDRQLQRNHPTSAA